MQKYFGNFAEDRWNDSKAGWPCVADHFDVKISEPDVVFAAYSIDGYEGDALVLFRQDGKLWEVSGSHCSCFGLEGQWEPEEVTLDELRHRVRAAGRYGVWKEFTIDIWEALRDCEGTPHA